jgi:hypothetical protein
VARFWAEAATSIAQNYGEAPTMSCSGRFSTRCGRFTLFLTQMWTLPLAEWPERLSPDFCGIPSGDVFLDRKGFRVHNILIVGLAL